MDIPYAIKTLEKVYGKETLSRMLKCRLGTLDMLKKKKRKMLTVSQSASLKRLMFLEEMMGKNETAFCTERQQKQRYRQQR